MYFIFPLMVFVNILRDVQSIKNEKKLAEIMQVQIDEFKIQKSNLCGDLIVILLYFESNPP